MNGTWALSFSVLTSRTNTHRHIQIWKLKLEMKEKYVGAG